jgi:hypothetical protein
MISYAYTIMILYLLSHDIRTKLKLKHAADITDDGVTLVSQFLIPKTILTQNVS